MAAEAPSFSPELFAFLRELQDHNEREWFNANKARYEQDVKEPALAFIEDIGYRLPEIAPHLTADKRSLFRIYRDTRFSKDKTPYKTHVGLYFRHARSADADTAGMFLHLEPGSVFMGAGIWRPGSPALKRIRDAIVARPSAWTDAVEAVQPTWEQVGGRQAQARPHGLSERPSARRGPQAPQLRGHDEAHAEAGDVERIPRRVPAARRRGATVHGVPLLGAGRRVLTAQGAGAGVSVAVGVGVGVGVGVADGVSVEVGAGVVVGEVVDVGLGVALAPGAGDGVGAGVAEDGCSAAAGVGVAFG